MKSFIDAAREHSRGLRNTSPTRDMGQARIVVVGCGGAGNNTVKRLMTVGIQGAECIAINTDKQHLAVTTAHRKLLIGESITRGLGAGGYPHVGRAAAEESTHQLSELLRDADLAFITAGMEVIMMKDPNQVIIRPIVTEASLEAVDNENKLILLVDRRANKDTIRWAVETLYDVVVVKINTMIDVRGQKKAYVRLAPEYSAADIATKLGIF